MRTHVLHVPRAVAVLITALLVAGPAHRAGATPIAYDGFQYDPPGAPLNTYAPGGTGWSGAWSGTPTVIAPGRTYSDGTRTLDTQGNALSCSVSSNTRTLAIGTPLGDTPSTLWMSMIARQTGGSAAFTFAGLTLPCTGPNSLIFFGKPYNLSHWGTDAGGSFHESSVLATDEAFLVLRIDFKAGLDDVYMWVNPPLGAEPSTASADVQAPGYGDFSGITTVSLASSCPAEFDEVRLGTTWEDVGPQAVVIAAGLPDRPIGDALVNVDPGGHLVISNIGSSGNDGVETDLGETGNGGLSLGLGSSMLAGYSLATDVIGTLDGTTETVLGTLTLADAGGGVGSLNLALAPGMNIPSFTVKVFDGDSLVYTDPDHPGTGITYQPLSALHGGRTILSPGQPIGGLDVTLVKKPAGIVATNLDDESNIDLGTKTVTGNRIEIISNTSPPAAATQTKTRLRVKNASQVTITDAALSLGDDAYRTGGGTQVAFEKEAGPAAKPGVKLTGFGLGGDDGLLLSRTRWAGDVKLEANLVPARPPRPASQIMAVARGTLGASPDTALGRVWWSGSGDPNTLSADFSALGASSASVDVYSGATFVGGSVVVAGGAVASVAGSAGLSKIARGAGEPFEIVFDGTVTVTPNGGSPLIGDRVLIGPAYAAALAQAGTPGETVDELQILGVDLDSLVVVDPLPPVLAAPPPRGAGASLAIERLFPNPARSGITVALALPSAAPARIRVFDVLGRRVESVDLAGGAPGRRTVALDRAGTLPAGLYLVRVEQNGSSAEARAVVMR